LDELSESPPLPAVKRNGVLSRFRGMMNTPQLTAPFLGVAIFDTARLAARSFIILLGPCGERTVRKKESPAFSSADKA
jgi:hypothetical protein